MGTMQQTHFLLLLLYVFYVGAASPEFALAALVADSEDEYHSVLKLAIADVNADETLLPDLILTLNKKAVYTEPLEIQEMINFSDTNDTFVVGNEFSFLSVLTGVVGNVFGVAQLSSSATSSALSDTFTYPYFSRISPPTTGQVFIMYETLLHYANINGRGWTDVALVSTTDAFGVDGAKIFIERAEEYGITISTYQQYISDSDIFEIEVAEILKSGSRVIVAFVLDQWEPFIIAAGDAGLVGDQYVWMVPDSIVGYPVVNEKAREYSRGTLGSFQYIPDSGVRYDELVSHWQAQDPIEYPAAGPGTIPGPYAILGYDMIFTAAHAIQTLYDSGELFQERIPVETWVEALRAVELVGIIGDISFDDVGDIRTFFSMSHYVPENDSWIRNAIWSEQTTFVVEEEIVWFSNTTTIPDLDVRDPFNYWSCHNKELRSDPTGKEIEIETPDGSNVDDIDSNYHCDHFIDCYNLSDESYDCTQNFMVLFIVFGLITGFLIAITLMLIVFVFIFGIILKYRKLRVASPTFLMIMLFSILFGYFSVFAWFGKPHPVACAFQPWLLGLSVICMVNALCVKIYRIWRIFQNSLRAKKIADWQLVVFWFIITVPAIFILVLWTLISTPTASMEERDGEDHYVCNTGGFTGEPGGIVFFAIMVVYTAIILVFGIFLSIVTRKVPSMFNESKLLAISIYNLVFLSVVIIPVFIVVDQFNPFLAWIIRTSAVLYAFTATLSLQFFPAIVGIVFIDHFKDPKDFKSIQQSTSHGSRGSQSGQ